MSFSLLTCWRWNQSPDNLCWLLWNDLFCMFSPGDNFFLLLLLLFLSEACELMNSHPATVSSAQICWYWIKNPCRNINLRSELNPESSAHYTSSELFSSCFIKIILGEHQIIRLLTSRLISGCDSGLSLLRCGKQEIEGDLHLKQTNSSTLAQTLDGTV